ncbi:MAG: PEGA domain-containing protein [Fibrobacterota bacterium]
MKYILILLICSSATFASEQGLSSSIDSHSVAETNPDAQENDAQENDVATESSTSLRITTNTDSVIVLVNRNREGMTPLLLEDISPGTYNIMLLKQGYERIQKSIDISAGERRTVTAELTKTAEEDPPVTEKAEDTSSSEIGEEKHEEPEERRIFEIVATSVFAAMVILITAFELSDS